VYLKNKKSLEQMPFSRKVNLFEHGDMLDENNIHDEIK
jgi:hypothetical protein